MKHNVDYERMVLEIRIEAEHAFGSVEISENWLTQHNVALGDSPLKILRIKDGVLQVRQILTAIANGGCV
jgi:hypothetical protein